ncbi:sensor histidine kinase [Jongsikchunia kroppenstedtii]|uniref:sensor histidine kinase n=1 Tax=Jongsikchunia kroppenstedtii TaxID=1121721 RepID=UPI000376D559|nr:HAMP domain-containing sensor histidine kinase [Jongsikchunia kroppenstedtii]
MSPRAPLGPGSLRSRVTVIALIVLTLALAAVVLITATLFRAASHQAVNSLLSDRAATARQIARTAATPEEFLRRIDVRSVRARLELADGTVLGTHLEPSDTEVKRVVRLVGGRPWTRGARVTFYVDNKLLEGVRSRLLWEMSLTALGALSLTALLLWIGVRYALSPLDAMTSLARSIAHGHRGGRLSPRRSDTELGRTAVAFDDMLDSLEGAEARERAAQQSMRRFVADAAHELRTPITGVQAIAETVLHADDNTPAEDRQQLLLLLVQETKRASRIVDDMLDIARLDTGGLTLQLSPTDVAVLATEQARRGELLHPGVQLSVRGAAPAVLADPERISQILANVLDNACRAAASSGTVRIEIEHTETTVSVTITDSGPGVAPADRERIFDRMVRLDESRDRRAGGAGLGLTVARGLARAHGGELSLLDTTGPGAAFRLDLPYRPPS